jgi:hypothetical protein
MDSNPIDATMATTRPEQERPILSFAQRHGFPDWLMIYGWLVIAFILFQVVAAIVVIVGLIGQPGVNLADLADPSKLSSHFDLLFLGNSLGQGIAFGLLTLGMIALTKRDRWSELLPMGWQPTTGVWTLITAIGIIVAAPALWMLAWLNTLIPMPDAIIQLEKQQTDLIASFLKSDFNVLVALMHVALVPAIFEEILYRGYVLHMLKRTKAIWTAILISGIIFGLYHLRLTQAIPLSLIGIFLGWITWRSGSLIPAMVVHFVNNASSVLLVRYMPESPLASATPEMPPVWLVAISLVLSFVLLRWLNSYSPDSQTHV